MCHRNKSCHTCERGMSRIWMSHVTHINVQIRYKPIIRKVQPKLATCLGGTRMTLQGESPNFQLPCGVLQCVAVCCSVLQCVAVCCGVLHCVAVCCSENLEYGTRMTLQGESPNFRFPYWVLQCVAVCCSVLQCVAVCCSVLQCVATLNMGTRMTLKGESPNFQISYWVMAHKNESRHIWMSLGTNSPILLHPLPIFTNLQFLQLLPNFQLPPFTPFKDQRPHFTTFPSFQFPQDNRYPISNFNHLTLMFSPPLW